MISVTFTDQDALRVLALLRADDERIEAERAVAKARGFDELEAAILSALPCPRDEVYARAGIPRPWYRAGRALGRLRQRGLVVWTRDGYALAEPPK